MTLGSILREDRLDCELSGIISGLEISGDSCGRTEQGILS